MSRKYRLFPECTVTGGAVAGDANLYQQTGCQEWDQLIPIMEEEEHQTDDAEEDGLCVIKHLDFLSHINPGLLETIFRMPRINLKRRATPDGPNGKLSEV